MPANDNYSLQCASCCLATILFTGAQPMSAQRGWQAPGCYCNWCMPQMLNDRTAAITASQLSHPTRCRSAVDQRAEAHSLAGGRVSILSMSQDPLNQQYIATGGNDALGEHNVHPQRLVTPLTMKTPELCCTWRCGLSSLSDALGRLC